MKQLCPALLLFSAVLPAAAQMPVAVAAADEAGRDNPLRPSPTWDSLRADVLGRDVEPGDAAGLLTVEAPFRAADPAVVPLRIGQPAGAPAIDSLIVVVDENPSPVVATFHFAPAMQPVDMELRIRVNSYSDVRAIATLHDGRQVMAGRFVRASGGCAAPAGSGAGGTDRVGEMRLRTAAQDGRQVSTLMIRHPNFSGFQRDQVTLLPIPARFIDTLQVSQGGEPLFTMEGGISISENPVFRFAHSPSDAPVEVRATDIDGVHFDRTLAVGAAG